MGEKPGPTTNSCWNAGIEGSHDIVPDERVTTADISWVAAGE